LAEAINARLEDPPGSRQVAEAAYAAADRFDVETIVDDLVELYERAAAGTYGGDFGRDVYNRGYGKYFHPDERSDPFHRIYAAKRDSVLRALGEQPPLDLLDVGGGYGRLAAPLARRHRVTLVDVSP